MKIICVGRNYAQHTKELNNELPKEPVLFLKPESAILLKRLPFFYPDFSKDVHYEAELVVKINRVGKHIDAKFAHKYYNELTVGIDFTARDLQSQLKGKGLPWEKAKAFDGSAALGKWVDKSEIKNPNNMKFELMVNGISKQIGESAQMLFSIDTLISEISKYFTLKIGDLIFTGTPAGVGPVSKSDQLTAYLENRKLLDLKIK
ncbi:MAG: 2-hydroxyhepta-2,4-diene-1,7-dioate isomerase [Verrucomicrobia bacterium]|nr:2-hydroxyhepta-2,4-diene-1,7-dioate isomerase [Verrucomicrobiota bacterium]|tara:strand:- start:1913 stop:2524 length:612 start_codon:yes stop_codon:yes gene_type:complete